MTCIFIGNICNTQKLFKGNLPEREFDTDHLHTRLALAINATGQTQAPEFFVVYFTLTKCPDLFLEIDDILFYNRVFEFGAKTLHIILVECDRRDRRF